MTWLLVIFYCTVEVFTISLPAHDMCESLNAIVVQDVNWSRELWEGTHNLSFYKGKCVLREEYPTSPPTCSNLP